MYGKEPGSGYQPYLDILRVLAALFVIAIHTVSYAASLLPAENTSYKVLTLLVFTFVSCNLLFIMISGALLLPVQNESAGAFYWKRIRKVVVPLVIYYVLYVCAKEGIAATLALGNLPRLFLRILSGAPEEAPHFWLIYVLVFLYILTPVLRWFLQRVPDFVCNGLVVVIFFTNALSCYLPLLGIELPILQRIVETYAGIFILGYYLAKEERIAADYFFLTAGGISYLITAYLIFCTTGYERFIYGNAPTMMFYAAAIFVLVKRCGKKNTTSSPEVLCSYHTPKWLFVRLMGRYSYPVLLIHWGVLHFCVKQVLHVNVLSGGIWGGCIVMFLLTSFLSLLGAIVLENTLMRAIDKICNYLSHKIGVHHGIKT